MKKSILIPLCLFLSLFITASSAMGETLFGPKQYFRTKGAADVYTDEFSATPGEAMLRVENGTAEGLNRVSSASIVLNGQEMFGTKDFSEGVYILESLVNITDNNSITVTVKTAKEGCYITVLITRGGVQPPTVDISADPDTIQAGATSTLTWTSANTDSCDIQPDVGPVDPNGSTTVSPTDTTTYTITATGPGGTATDNVTVTVTKMEVTVFGPKQYIRTRGAPDVYNDTFFSNPGGAMITVENGNADGTQRLNDALISVNGQQVFGPDDFSPGVYILEAPVNLTESNSITAELIKGKAGTYLTVIITQEVEPQPEGSFGAQYEDLIPPDATAEYDPKRFSLITGLVQDLDGFPITDVSIAIHDHPEYGTASTDTAGLFTIPVEGGCTHTVVYKKEGLITAHRQIYVPWNEIAAAETIRMIAQDPASTTVTFDGKPNTVVTHQSTEVTDDFGSRSCTIVFTGDNQAHEVDADGNIIQDLSTITTRATEFTTPESMPAKLPPNSGYTYCAELGVDGAERVQFDKPVVTWVDNFLGFEVGESVPVGYYDRDRAVWVPSDNGVVVKLLDTDTDGIVDALDADGDDQPDDLNGNSSFIDEVTGLDDPVKYPPGATFWRVAVMHFTPWDCNWPYGPPQDATAPNQEGEPAVDQQNEEEKECERRTGSFVEERSRIFHEDIPIPGTDITLHYASNRVEGYKAIISSPASGDTVPASLKKIIAKVEIAGRTLEQVLDPLPNQEVEFEWDGLDHLGRRVSGSVNAQFSIGFVYNAVYYRAGDFVQAFAQAGSDVTGIQAREEVISWRRSDVGMYRAGRVAIIAEGWTLSAHHNLSPIDPSTLYKGDGTTAKNNINIINTLAGVGEWGYSGDGGPATEALIQRPKGMALDSEGNLYFADSLNDRIRKVDTSGIITTVAGIGTAGYSGDGGPATEAALYQPTDVAVDSAGNLYIADFPNDRIRKVDTSGIITTVAGNGTAGYSGDGGPATEASLHSPNYVTVDSAGNLYISDNGNYRLRKVDTSGIITTVAGNGTSAYNGDGGPATEASLSTGDVVVDSAGNIYITDGSNYRIRKIDTNGIITTFAGNGTYGYYLGDGGPAIEAQLKYPGGLALDSAGNIYIANAPNDRLRKVDTSGIITTVAGNGTEGYSGDGGLATEASFDWPSFVAVDSAGNLYIADEWNWRIRKVGPPSVFVSLMTGGNIPFAEEDGLGHIMSSSGCHKTTFDLDTGVVLREFGYNEDNQLVSITDPSGNQITIQWENGVPTSITSPDGLSTTLTIDANNHLTGITYPNNSIYGFAYTPDGLMTQKTEPNENVFGHQFDSAGRLTDATDNEGGHWQFSRAMDPNGDIIYQVVTGEDNITSYLDHTYSTGAYTSEITGASGGVTSFNLTADGLTATKSLSCGMDLSFKYGLDPEYKFKYVKEVTESTPSALEKISLRDKTYEDTNSDDIPDLITKTVTINDKPTTIENNVLQSQKSITSPEGRTVTTLYDPNTLLTTSLTIPGLYESTYGYDTSGRLTSIDTGTRGTDFIYNVQGFLESVTDPENQTTSYTYDEVGRVIRVDRPDITSVWFDYDNNGNMTVLTNPSTIDHVFGFNKVNMNYSYQMPISGTYSYIYDKDRRLKQINFPSGNQSNRVYENDRLMQIQTPEGNIDLSYLCSTKVESITNGTDMITYGYDGSLVTSETLSGTLNQILSYGYNNDFNLTSLTYGGGTVNYIYDNDGLLTEAGGFTISRNAGNGLPEAVTGSALNLSRTFNGYGEVEAQYFTVNSSSVTDWSLTRDDNGRITANTETVDGVTSNYSYTYDPMGRLLTVTKDGSLVEEYQYDLNGTRTYENNVLRGTSRTNFEYSVEDCLLSVDGNTYEYNADGFLTTKTVGSDITFYDYSSRGELLGITLPDGTTIDYVHDPLGRRIAKKVDGVIIEKYLWKGLTQLLAVYDGSDNLVMRFEYADGRMPVAMTKGVATYYLTYDQVGSLRVVADASGNVVKRIDYDSFGNIITDTDPTFDVPFGFAGGLHDRGTALVRFGYRDYDPDTGRWTAKDPIGFAGGDTDLYGYCLSDPVNTVDPEGLYLSPSQQFTVSIISGLGSAVGGILGGGPLGSALGSATAGAIATAFMPCATGADIGNSAFTGLLSGATGAGVANLLMGTTMSGMQAAVTTGIITGMTDSLLMGADPVF